MNVFMQMFKIRARPRILPRVLSVRETEEGHFLLKKNKGHCCDHSMLNGCVCLVGYLCVY